MIDEDYLRKLIKFLTIVPLLEVCVSTFGR